MEDHHFFGGHSNNIRFLERVLSSTFLVYSNNLANCNVNFSENANEWKSCADRSHFLNHLEYG